MLSKSRKLAQMLSETMLIFLSKDLTSFNDLDMQTLFCNSRMRSMANERLSHGCGCIEEDDFLGVRVGEVGISFVFFLAARNPARSSSKSKTSLARPRTLSANLLTMTFFPPSTHIVSYAISNPFSSATSSAIGASKKNKAFASSSSFASVSNRSKNSLDDSFSSEETSDAKPGEEEWDGFFTRSILFINTSSVTFQNFSTLSSAQSNSNACTPSSSSSSSCSRFFFLLCSPSLLFQSASRLKSSLA